MRWILYETQRFEPHPFCGGRKCFCSRCGSQLFIRRQNRPEITVITLGTLDDAPSVKPTRYVFTASKAPWYEIDEALPRFDVYPAQERGESGRRWPGRDRPARDLRARTRRRHAQSEHAPHPGPSAEDASRSALRVHVFTNEGDPIA